MTHNADNDVSITEAACQRLRGYVDQHEGMCWCGFDSEGLNDEGSTLDHIVHSLVDDWPGFLAATRPIPPADGGADDPTVFIGSQALITALYETYVEHIGIAEPDGPDGPYMWCACGWRSDDLGPNDNPGNSYAVHLTNAQHAAAVKALQPIVRRVLSPAKTEGDS